MGDVVLLETEDAESAPRQLEDGGAAHAADADHDRVIAHGHDQEAVTVITDWERRTIRFDDEGCGPFGQTVKS